MQVGVKLHSGALCNRAQDQFACNLVFACAVAQSLDESKVVCVDADAMPSRYMTTVFAALRAVSGDGGGAGYTNHRRRALSEMQGASICRLRHCDGCLL